MTVARAPDTTGAVAGPAGGPPHASIECRSRSFAAGLAPLCLLTLLGACRSDPAADEALALVTGYGCQTCHVIPGAPQPQGVTGPPLDHMGQASYVAGVIPNSPEAVATFIADPQEVDPRSAMPDLGVTPDEARKIADYLHDVSPAR